MPCQLCEDKGLAALETGKFKYGEYLLRDECRAGIEDRIFQENHISNGDGRPRLEGIALT
jgi:hypothetical protein